MPDSSRRNFLKLLGAAATLGLQGTFNNSEHAIASEERNYKVLPWAGDDFTLGHRLRDGEAPKFPDKAERKVDFVIVGGGMAGLCSAHFLKGENFLLLEQYAQTGGTSSGGSYNGIDYSMGAVCTGSHDGEIGKLFEELSLKPALIPPDQIAWHYDNKWVKGNSGADKFYSELNRFAKESNDLSQKLQSPNSADRDALSQKLASSTFDTLLKGYDAGFVKLVSNICRSFYCGGPDYIAAAAGLGLMRILTTDSYVCDGGNSGIARALKRSLDASSPDRYQTSAFVWLVEPTEKGASVVFSDKNGEMHRVNCKHAVVAAPPFVTARIAPKLSQAYREKLQSQEYAAFLVANFCMKKKVFQNPYQSFADEPYPYGQMVMAEAPYQATGRYKPEMGSVLTVYHPYEHGPMGRAQLLAEDDREKLADSLIQQLNTMIEGFQGSLDQVVLTRWGHAFSVPSTTSRSIRSQIQGMDPEWMSFAHSSSRGQSFEGAVASARYAADRCLKVKSKV